MPNLLDDWGVFPKIGLIVGGRKKFYSLQEAVPLWDSGMFEVKDSGEVLLSDFSVRTMTKDESMAFESRVDDYAAER